jgi:hypothetical protein
MSTTVNSYTGNIHAEGYISLHKQDENPQIEAEHGSLFAKDDGGTTRLYAMDSGGNVTQISPHDENGDWVFVSTNIQSGKLVRINMTKMIKRLEEITGESFIEESS